MPKTLDDFADWEEDKPWEKDEPIPKTHPRLDVAFLTRRAEMFMKMTQGKGKPMVYGATKKDKR